jgi:hypothetical protein
VEDQEHLFLHCPDAARIWRHLGWNHIFHLGSVKDLWLSQKFKDNHSPKSASTIATAILWNILKARNSSIFRQEHHTVVQVIRSVVVGLHLWSLRARASDAALILWWENYIGSVA